MQQRRRSTRGGSAAVAHGRREQARVGLATGRGYGPAPRPSTPLRVPSGLRFAQGLTAGTLPALTAAKSGGASPPAASGPSPKEEPAAATDWMPNKRWTTV